MKKHSDEHVIFLIDRKRFLASRKIAGKIRWELYFSKNVILSPFEKRNKNRNDGKSVEKTSWPGNSQSSIIIIFCGFLIPFFQSSLPFVSKRHL